MFRLTVVLPSQATEAILDRLEDDEAVSALVVWPGAARKPVGDVISCDLAREGANEVIELLRRHGVHESGTIHLQPVPTWISRAAYEAERATPGSSADAVVWADVTQRAYEESELNWTYLSFMTLATLIASIALILDSQVLVIGAMVLGPEFVAVAALGLAAVRRRPGLFALAARTLLVGFGVAIAITTVLALVARGLGWIDAGDLTAPRPDTGFVYKPDRWSLVVAAIAGAAGVLSLTSAKVGGLSGVFISVTTVPAAGNLALAVALGLPGEMAGSAEQLAINLVGMAVAGWATLSLQRLAWGPWARRRRRWTLT